MSEFSEVFKEELGVLKGTLQLNYNQQPSLAFVKPTSIFCIKGAKVETLLKAQVDQGELRSVDKAEWATPIVVVPK